MQPATLLSTLFTSLHLSDAWTSMSDGNMEGVTFAGGAIYNTDTMCPNNVNQGYVCDGRNFGDKYLNPLTVSSFCTSYPGTSLQYGFGHGVSSTQKCGECAQIRVPRTDGSFNYMTVMMVDHFTWSMEVGTPEIAHLVDDTEWAVGDYADFEFRLVGDCYASFDDDADGDSSTVVIPTPQPTTTSIVDLPATSPVVSDSANCAVSSNWDAMTISPYWGSSNSFFYAVISDAPSTISSSSQASFEIRGFGQSDAEFQSCSFQNVNSFQCSDFEGGALTEPATVRLTMLSNEEVYYGENVITSMTGSLEKYGATTCSSSAAFAFTDEENDEGNEGAPMIEAISTASVAFCCLCVIGVIVVWRCRICGKKGTAYFKEDEDVQPKEETVGQETENIVVETEV